MASPGIEFDHTDGYVGYAAHMTGGRLFLGDEALKRFDPPHALRGGRVNDITVPPGARWVYLRFSDERPDLANEVTDAATIRQFREYVVAQAGWFDINHFSRPQKIPPEWVKAGLSPSDFKIGKIVEIRVSEDGKAFAAGFLWPKGRNPHADRMWQMLEDCPESVHCSIGGPTVSRTEERDPKSGRKVFRVKILMNHIALCDQGVHIDTEVRLTPFGEFLKAIVDGVPAEPCDGEGCFSCFVRGEPETDKSVVSAGGAGGINAMGLVPENLEGSPLDLGAAFRNMRGAVASTRRPIRLKSFDEGPINCGHFRDKSLPSWDHATAHMKQCLGWSRARIRSIKAEMEDAR